MFRLLIVGATGLVGNKALSLALQDARVSEVVVVSRRPVKPHPKLRNYVLDFATLPLDEAYWQVDAVLCALGTTKRESKSQAMYNKIDVEYPLAIAQRAKHHGAQSFALVSSAGASVISPSSYLRRKGEIENSLAALKFSSLTIIRPSFIDGEREQSRFGERALASMLRTLEPVLPKRWRLISADKIAKALLDSVLRPKPGLNFLESDDLQNL